MTPLATAEAHRNFLPCCQVEESYIGAEEFCRVVQQQESVVLQGEITLLEAIHFDLFVYAPYRPLQGFIAVSLS